MATVPADAGDPTKVSLAGESPNSRTETVTPLDAASVPTQAEWKAVLERLRELEARLQSIEKRAGHGDSSSPATVGPAEAAKPESGISEEELAELQAAMARDAAADDESSDSIEADPPMGTDTPPSRQVQASPATGQKPQYPGPTTSPAPTIVSPAIMNPEMALIADIAFAWFSRDKPLQLGAHDPSRRGFNLQQLEMKLGASVDPLFRLDANLVFSQFGVEVEEAYATTLGLSGGLQVRAGQFLTQIGRINNSHPHVWSFVDQPLVNGKFLGSEGSRGLGVELSWLVPLPWYVELVASLGDARGECCARSFLAGDALELEHPGDLLATLALRQFHAPNADWGVNWGASAQLGPNASGPGNRSEIYALDLHLRYRPRDVTPRRHVTLQVEAMHRRRQVPGRILADWGGYSQLVWGITPAWELGVRHDWVTGVADDPLDPDWAELRQRSSLQVTHYTSHFSRLRLQASGDRIGGEETSWGWSLFAAIEVMIGAHGAHEY